MIIIVGIMQRYEKMRHNLLTKVLVLVLALLVLIPNMGLGVFAADDGPTNEGGSDTPTESFDVSGSKKASPNLLIGEDRETTVTLSLPSAEYKNEIDIVFTMDSSSSAQNCKVFMESVNTLFNSILENNPTVTLKIGVIIFRGRAYDAVKYMSDGKYSELTVYNEDTEEYIKNAINFREYFRLQLGLPDFNDSYVVEDLQLTQTQIDAYNKSIDNAIKADFGSGSNTHGGIDIADEWLDADTELDNSQKYMVLMTDGKTYIWNDENNEPTTMYAQWYRSNKYNMQNNGKPTINQLIGYDKYDYPVDVLDPTGKSNIFVFKPSSYPSGEEYKVIDKMLTVTESEMPGVSEMTGVSEWDVYCAYADGKGTPDGSVVKHTVTNGSSLFSGDFQYWYEFTPNDTWTGVKYLEANPYLVIDNGDGTYTFDIENHNPNYYMYHVDPLQKGIYMAAKLWKEVNTKYNCAVITYDQGSEGGGLELRHPFNEWLRRNSRYGSTIQSSTDIQALFEGIDNSIRYTIDRGVVTDVIKDNFDLKNPDKAEGFRMTYNGEDLTATFADGIWSFDDGNYTVTYDAESKTITWTINVPIENLKPVTLSYDLLLTEGSAKTSKIYDTNESAKLVYKSTDGKRDGTFTFEKPKVAYIKLIDIDVEKVWSDNNNQDGKRYTEITVELVEVFDDEEEEVVDKVVLNEKSWKYTFKGLYDATAVFDENDNPVEIVPITYSVKEVTVEDYTSELSGTATEGFVITNTHTPETIDIKIEKIWYDEDPSLRPASIKVDLLADEEPVESVELSEKTGWKATFEGMPKYSNGEEIMYDVSESGIDVKTYRSDVSGTAANGFTITNTQTFDLSIKKVWNDEDDKDGVRPEEIFVTVLANDEPIGMAVLDEESGWEITLLGMPVFLNGEKLEYSVEEEEVEDYEEPEIIFKPDYGFIITNTHKVEEPPKTDDATNQWFWAGMMVSSMALIAVIFYLKRKQDEK
ncbi:MAG: Cna B-type domain-containing protein [Oscillospiraceae bacterium]|nr:Cna B-type domain-containing protein [Oscillospiraceae bacterium]